MRTYYILFLFIIVTSTSSAQSLRFMTYNIRYATAQDGDNQWENRKDYLSGQIAFYAPDVFGIQEGLDEQVTYLEKHLEAYAFVGVGRDDGEKKGEYCAIFYKKDRLQLLGYDTFWLSETPEIVSKGWDAALERICTYALFMDLSTGNNFWVFNTHFDHIGERAREKSAELIVQKIKALNKDGLPVIVLGDLNLNDQSKAIVYLSSVFDDSRKVSVQEPFGPFGTFTGFAFDKPVQDRIDYIFCSQAGVKVEKYGVLTDSKNGRYPSDHFPVMIEIVLDMENPKN